MEYLVEGTTVSELVRWESPGSLYTYTAGASLFFPTVRNSSEIN